MLGSKKSIAQQLKDRIAKKKAIQKKMADRVNNVEQYVLDMIGEIDSMQADTVNTSLAELLVPMYTMGILSRLQRLDADIKIDISWQEHSSEMPRINGILLKWSPAYQKTNNCEPELFVDVASLLFK